MSEFGDNHTLSYLDGPKPGAGVAHATLVPGAAAAGAAGLPVRILDTIVTAALICDGRGRVVLTNAAARRFHREGVLQFGLGSGDPAIATLERGTTRALRQAIADSAQANAHSDAGGVVQVPRRAPLSFLLANVAPLVGDMSAPFALVLIADPLDLATGIERHVRAAFGATPAEARLGAALARGSTRQEHAAAMGVKASTVKTQLGGLFLKTDTRREADLVRLLLSIPRFARDAGSVARAVEDA
jgi:DNA-binding CsgD family transcriptional regulator